MEQSHGGHKLLASVSIRELEINALDAQYVEPVRFYLEGKLGCSFACQAGGRYVISFPPGTVEETGEGRSTCWTRETVIRLASGSWFRKLVMIPINPQMQKRVALAFPPCVLHGEGMEQRP